MVEVVHTAQETSPSTSLGPFFVFLVLQRRGRVVGGDASTRRGVASAGGDVSTCRGVIAEYNILYVVPRTLVKIKALVFTKNTK